MLGELWRTPAGWGLLTDPPTHPFSSSGSACIFKFGSREKSRFILLFISISSYAGNGFKAVCKNAFCLIKMKQTKNEIGVCD